MTPDERTELIAALNQLAKALETERACVIRVMRLIERKEPEVKQPVTISDRDSIAGIIAN